MPDKIYDENIDKQIVKQEVYLGYQYYIVSYGSHPCCYIKLTKKDKLYKVDYSNINLLVHGGMTYSRSELWCDNDDAWYIGWDYAHYGDYMLCKYNNELIMEGHKWTLNELQEDVKKTIEELFNMNEKNKD